jgi:hypothetical protein
MKSTLAMSATPISMKGGGTGSTALRLTSLSGRAYVYTACSTESPNATCSVDTGNLLNASAADFSERATQMAKVTVVLTTNSTDSRVGPVTITAYTASGDQSTLGIPVDNP